MWNKWIAPYLTGSLWTVVLKYLAVLAITGGTLTAMYTYVYNKGYSASEAACTTKMLEFSGQINTAVATAVKDISIIARDLKHENEQLKVDFEQLAANKPKTVIKYRDRDTPVTDTDNEPRVCDVTPEYVEYLNNAIGLVNRGVK